jgi:hypothetical protein
MERNPLAALARTGGKVVALTSGSSFASASFVASTNVHLKG